MTLVDGSTVPWAEQTGVSGTFKRKPLGEAASGDRLGCSLYEVPPGGQAWSYHFHTANEEAFYILAGEGTVRLDGETHPIAAGDYVACPAGSSGAHAVRNDGDEMLRYLAVSSTSEPDVTVHPDEGLIGVFADVPLDGEESGVDGFYDPSDRIEDPG